MRYLFALLIWCLPHASFGWGQDGHKIVALSGAKLAFKGTKFWTANAQNIVQLSIVPDSRWKIGNLYEPETVTHYFQPDSYYKDPAQFSKIPHDFKVLSSMAGSQKAIEWGSAPWRIQQFYNLTVQALKKRDFRMAVEMAGVMSHYIGDLSQPLHVTENYDGQLTNNKGIHKFFETTNIKPYASELEAPVTNVARQLLSNSQFQKMFNGKVVDEAFNETYRAYSMKDKLIDVDKTLGRAGEGAKQLLNLAVARMGDGAATFAVVLSHAWVESGLADEGATGQITPPDWVQPDYYSMTQGLLEQIETKTRRLLLGDDCGL